MAITLQRKLELAGALSRVQPELQRLHLLPRPRKRNRLRNVVLVASVIAAGAAVAVVVLRHRGGNDEVDSPLMHDTPAAEPNPRWPATDADGPQDDDSPPGPV